MKKKKLYLVAYVLLLIVYTKFFEFRPIAFFLDKLLVLVFFVLLAFTLHKLSYKNGIFIKPIKYIIYSIFLGIIPSLMFWNQSLVESFKGISQFSYFLLFLFLIKARISPNLIVKTILVFSYCGLILYAIQFFLSGTVLFGAKEEFFEDRGIIRIVFPGEGFMFFALFYYLNKFGRNFTIKYFLLILPFVVMMLLQVTRVYILAFGLIATYHFMIKSKSKYRIAAIVGFLFCYSFYYNSDNSIVKGIKDATESDVDQKEDNIRLLEANYFLFDLSNNDISYLIGNGAYYNSSSFGKKLLSLSKDYNFYLDDLGLLKGYILFGILFVLGYVLIFIKSFTFKIPYDLLYLKYNIWLVLFFSFTTRASTNAGFGVVFVSVLYLYELAYLEQRNLIATKSTVVQKKLSTQTNLQKNLEAP
jgi:hypothetical protein